MPTSARPSGLRLAVYTDADQRGGAEVSLRTLVAHLDPEIQVTVMGTDQAILDWVAAARPDTPTHLLPAITGKTSLGPMLAHRRAVRRLRPDVIHCSLNTMADARWAVLTFVTSRRTPVVAVEQLPLAPAERSVILIKRLGSSRLAAHIAVGDRAARQVEQAIGLPPGRVRTIYNGVPDLGPARPRSGAGPVILGCLARLDPIKGLDLLIAAAASIEGSRVVVLGEGSARPGLLAQAASLGIADRVELRPWSDDARAVLDEVDIFVLPSRNEGFPLSIVEAMLAGRPVVATDVGSVAEAVVDGMTGRVVAPDDLLALIMALAPLVAYPALRARMGSAGRERAVERFTAETMATAFTDVYREVSAGRRAVRASRAAPLAGGRG